MSLGENIKKFRKENKLTQEGLAKLANLSRSYIADVEKDRYSPSLETLKTIANALGIKVSQLIGEDETVQSGDYVINNEILTEDEKRIVELALKQYREMKELAKKEADK
ncbi:hypothetical protein J1TS5_26270 [Paenibacillus macerans]|uniref:helix-turn-helix domain-containing protein n=1 Tax=Paenibacillus macerans TaxID=44252 RepID=UPI001B17D3A9|nr:helix-turn-helix transcriptional regulator [Paenibacillus macerans]GIP10457.1 hypothetical protein J1TS5_26270 [Paenibacillus macerans]